MLLTKANRRIGLGAYVAKLCRTAAIRHCYVNSYFFYFQIIRSAQFGRTSRLTWRTVTDTFIHPSGTLRLAPLCGRITRTSTTFIIPQVTDVAEPYSGGIGRFLEVHLRCRMVPNPLPPLGV